MQGRTDRTPAATLSYDMGVQRSFGRHDIALDGLSGDWAQPEEFHIWNDGEQVAVTLHTQVPASSCTIEIGGEPFLHARCPSQTIVLYANGFRIARWTVQDQREHVLHALVEPEHFFLRDGLGMLKLVLDIPTSRAPAELGASEDGRRLGFCFQSLLIRP